MTLILLLDAVAVVDAVVPQDVAEAILWGLCDAHQISVNLVECVGRACI